MRKGLLLLLMALAGCTSSGSADKSVQADQPGLWQAIPASGGLQGVWRLNTSSGAMQYCDIGRSDRIGCTEAQGPAPAVGAVIKGHRFKGGEPGDQKNWEKIN